MSEQESTIPAAAEETPASNKCYEWAITSKRGRLWKISEKNVIVENGEANCTELIEAHKECMRRMGFDI